MPQNAQYQRAERGCQPMGRLFVDSWSARLWPPRCVLCGAGVERELPAFLASGSDARGLHSAEQDICRGCLGDLPWLSGGCEACGLPLPESLPRAGVAAGCEQSANPRLCGACITAPLFTRCRVACEYSYPINQLVQALKFRRRRPLARVLGHLLGLAVLPLAAATRAGPATHCVPGDVGPVLCAQPLDELPEIILPVPLHRWRLFTRGYNQAEEIALCLPPVLRQRVVLNLCRRVRRTPMQTRLTRKQRVANLAAAFALTSKGERALAGKRIAIVDDVITTGATAQAMSRLLYAAGARRVEVWAVARTV